MKFDRYVSKYSTHYKDSTYKKNLVNNDSRESMKSTGCKSTNTLINRKGVENESANY